MEDLQAQGSADDEEILQAFESYADVRRKMLEKKKSRGFVETSRWKLRGTVNGKLEQLKANLCKRTGHWRRKCPLNRDVRCFQQCQERARPTSRR